MSIQDDFLKPWPGFNYSANSDVTGLLCEDPSLASQEFKEEVDINNIAYRYGISGQLPTNVRAPSFGDFTGVSDYQSALNAVMEADRSFMELPAAARSRFDNDPQQLLQFVEDPNNYDEAVSLGLAVRRPDLTIPPAALVPPPAKGD